MPVSNPYVLNSSDTKWKWFEGKIRVLRTMHQLVLAEAQPSCHGGLTFLYAKIFTPRRGRRCYKSKYSTTLAFFRLGFLALAQRLRLRRRNSKILCSTTHVFRELSSSRAAPPPHGVDFYDVGYGHYSLNCAVMRYMLLLVLCQLALIYQN